MTDAAAAAAAANTDTTVTGRQEIAPASEGKSPGNPISYEDREGWRATSPDIEDVRQHTDSPGTDLSLAVTTTSTGLGTPARYGEEKHSAVDDAEDVKGICSSSSSNSGDGEWDYFDAAFKGKTTSIHTRIPTTISSESGGRGGVEEAKKYPAWASSSAFSSTKTAIDGGVTIIQDEESVTAMTVPVDKTACEKEEEEGKEEVKSPLLHNNTIDKEAGAKEQHRQQQSNTQCSSSSPLSLVGLWERKKPTRRWVDQCALLTSSSDSSGSSCASSFELGSDEEEDEFVPICSAAVEAATKPIHLQVGSSITASAASAALNNGRYHDNMELKRARRKQPRCEPSTSRARRIPLSAYGGDPAMAAAALVAERNNKNGCNSSTKSSTPDNHRAFVWCIQLHGCLCEAPLAVLEGIIRAPCYFLAAAWVSTVGRVGASAPAQRENRDRLLGQAQALAREGALLLAACLTLALPCVTYFTIYANARDENVWDVRPVPTILGSVDPLRFFVFTHGQAGELAANGRPEPLISSPDYSFSPLTIPAAGTNPDGGANSGDNVILGKPSSLSLSSGRQAAGRHSDHVLPRFTQSPSAKCSYYSPIAAQSMDTDSLGVGILHPPREMEVRWQRAWASARRSVVEAFGRLEGHVRTVVTDNRV